MILYIFTLSIIFTCCRKEVRDPDVLYNMLKNLLAQIKVRVPAEHREGEREKPDLKEEYSSTEPS